MAENFWIAEEYHQKYVRKKKYDFLIYDGPVAQLVRAVDS